ncbi:GIY-YIG nuclease family protein [Flavobacterium sufflavum]|uniref:GIY-YIG nuclease family protein n=1 Tax=Flavobacterium sufflavum TaxID=1921138 RepID=A0A437L411_9FLAO|nr:GIY-YIG nuclease family protein [Flavobacterium sufflavum]RVT80043.1 GIY-YIG nuclease family protein [Flavobacterium sufflavum]
MHFVYIIYSSDKDTFYIGETSDIELRLQWHNSGMFKKAHTKIANDWTLFHLIECTDIVQARKIEKHIKDMKSKTYLFNLKKHPEISEKLLLKYS